MRRTSIVGPLLEKFAAPLIAFVVFHLGPPVGSGPAAHVTRYAAEKVMGGAHELASG